MNTETALIGNLRKMQTRLEDVAHYSLVLDGVSIDMNAKIGESIKQENIGTFLILGIST